MLQNKRFVSVTGACTCDITADSLKDIIDRVINSCIWQWGGDDKCKYLRCHTLI